MYVRLVSLPRLRGVGLASVAIFIVTVVYICFAPASIREQGMSSGPLSQHGRCTDKHEIVRTQSWQEIDAKFNNLTDEKFTVVIQTYKRMDELKSTLSILLSTNIPSLQEVFIVWNDLDNKPPKNFISKFGIPVRYRMSARNSLNEKMKYDPEYKTKAVFLSDDDIYYQPSDLEFAFQTWRKFGQSRITGSIPRCVQEVKPGKWVYDFGCSRKNGQDVYSMIITSLSFVHIGFLDYYSSDDRIMTKIRDYVDEKFNCEDIGLNFAASLVTRSGPLLIQGYNSYYNIHPKVSISGKKGHAEARSQCVTDFAAMIGCLPLVDETAHIARGVVRNTWLQWLGDVTGVV